MSDVGSGRAEADAGAAEAVQRHHAAMVAELAAAVAGLTEATAAGDVTAFEERRDALLRWSREELVPHAVAEESTLYAAAGAMPEARLLVQAMLAEHRAIIGLVDELERTAEPVAATGLARALQAVFEVHLAKENHQVLPLLVVAPDVAVADLLAGMHELLGAGAGAEPGADQRHDPPAPLATTDTSAKVDPTVFSAGGAS